MPYFSEASLAQLDTAHPELQRLFHEVIKYWDCTIIQGHRSVEEQKRLYAKGRSVPGSIVTSIDGVTKKSMHNHLPSLAVDVAPYPINWGDTERFYAFGGFVVGVAKMMHIPVRWGGDWDADRFVHDHSFIDLPHFEYRGAA